MQLSVITDEIAPGLDRALDVCEELGIGLVELRTVDSAPLVALDRSEIEGLGTRIAARGFRVSAVASPFLKCNRDEIDAEQTEINARAIRAARILAAPVVRAFSFWREPDPAAALPDLGDALRAAAETAHEAGVTLALENEHECNVASSAEARAALDETASPYLRLIWDAGNAAMLDPQGYAGVGGLETIVDRVAHVHLKDVDARRNWVRIGDGVVDHEALLRYLADAGYDGVLSFETHYRRDGSSELATRDCVASLREIAGRAGVELT